MERHGNDSRVRPARPTSRGVADAGRKVLVVIFVLVASASFAAYAAVRWAEKQVLNTDGWVAFSSKLPQNPEVSSALAHTLTTHIYANVPIEQKVAEALPPKAAFLAGPISDQLQTRTTNIVQRFVGSDSFQSVWTGANRIAMNRFLTNVRSGKEPGIQVGNENFSVDLGSLQPQLSQRLSDQKNISPALQGKAMDAFTITADLQAKRERLWRAVRVTDGLYTLLPAIFVASLLGVLALSHSKRRMLMLVAGIAIFLLLVELVMIKFGRHRLLGQVGMSSNVSAVAYVYDTLLGKLRGGILYAIGGWLVVLALCLLGSRARWAIRMRRALSMPQISQGYLGHAWKSLRAYTAKYRYIAWIVIAVVVFIYLALFATVSALVLINAGLIILAGIFAVQLLAYAAA